MVESNANAKISSGYRAIEIILGIVALAVGLLVLAFPSLVIITLIVFFELALFAIGILRLATAASPHWHSSGARTVNAAIGLLTVIVAVVMLVYPALAAATLVLLLGFALLIYGVGRITFGAFAVNLNMGLRAFLIIAGVIVVVFSAIVLAFPTIGI